MTEVGSPGTAASAAASNAAAAFPATVSAAVAAGNPALAPTLDGNFSGDIAWIGGPLLAGVPGACHHSAPAPAWFHNFDPSSEIKGFSKCIGSLETKFERAVIC